MDSARRELDRLSYEAWGQLARDLRTGSRSMGRVGLSYARRHPALLLGGGALLGFAAVAWFKGRKPAPTSAAPAVAAIAAVSPVKVATKPAWQSLLTKIVSMWIMDTLASEFRVEQEKRAEGDVDGEHEKDLEHAESLFSS